MFLETARVYQSADSDFHTSHARMKCCCALVRPTHWCKSVRKGSCLSSRRAGEALFLRRGPGRTTQRCGHDPKKCNPPQVGTKGKGQGGNAKTKSERSSIPNGSSHARALCSRDFHVHRDLTTVTHDTQTRQGHAALPNFIARDVSRGSQRESTLWGIRPRITLPDRSWRRTPNRAWDRCIFSSRAQYGGQVIIHEMAAFSSLVASAHTLLPTMFLTRVVRTRHCATQCSQRSQHLLPWFGSQCVGHSTSLYQEHLPLHHIHNTVIQVIKHEIAAISPFCSRCHQRSFHCVTPSSKTYRMVSNHGELEYICSQHPDKFCWRGS